MDSIEQKKIKNYKNGITAIIIFAALSVINVFSYAFTGTYFLFSSYVSLLVNAVLVELDFVGVAIVVSLIIVAPYVVFAILARKRPWAMIASLALVAIDTLFLLLDVLLTMDIKVIVSNIVDIICHGIIIVELVIAVVNKGAVKLMEEAKLNAMSFPDQITTEVLSNGQTVTVLNDACVSSESDNDSALANIKRSVTVTRKKAFAAAFAKFGVVLDGVEVAKLKNGESATIMVSGCSHAFCVQFANGNSDYLQIPAGTDDKSYLLTPVMKATSFYIQIDEV